MKLIEKLNELPDRIKDKLLVNEDTELTEGTHCIEWQGCLSTTGYGKAAWDGKSLLLHRVVFEHCYEALGDLHCLHKCDNPKCCNPYHLFKGTHQDNMEDKIQKGRHRALAGSEHPDAILTEDDVIDIRSSSLSTSELADKYGVHPSSISHARNGGTWKHLPRVEGDNTDEDRTARGESNASHVLVESEVREILQSKESSAVLAARYSVNKTTICRILKGELWKHIWEEYKPAPRRGHVKATEEMAKEIISRKGQTTNAEEAAKNGISIVLVSHIRSGKKFPHLDRPYL